MRLLVLVIGLASYSLYAQERQKVESKQLQYTYTKNGSLRSRLQKEIKYRKSIFYSEDTEDFLLYPNPADEFIIVNIKDFNNKRQFQLFNNLGKLIKTGVLTEQITELDFSNLQQGVYFFNLISLDTKINSTQKIIKK